MKTKVKKHIGNSDATIKKLIKELRSGKYKQTKSPEWLKQFSNEFSDLNNKFSHLTDISLMRLNDHGVPDYFSIAINTSFPFYETVDQSPFNLDEIADVLQMTFILKIFE